MLSLSDAAAAETCSDPASAVVVGLMIALIYLAKALSGRASLLVL